MSAINDILVERERQKSIEGWTEEHDDKHTLGQMALAASCYARECMRSYTGRVPYEWPWSVKWWKPKDHRKNLVRAGALIVAEIERLDRLSKEESR